MTRKETLKNEIVMIGSGKSAPFYLLTEKRDTIISYFPYNSGALAKGGMKEVTVNDIPVKAGYTRNLFLADVSGKGSNSVTVNLHSGSVSFYSPLVEANVTARIGCIYTRD